MQANSVKENAGFAMGSRHGGVSIVIVREGGMGTEGEGQRHSSG